MGRTESMRNPFVGRLIGGIVLLLSIGAEVSIGLKSPADAKATAAGELAKNAKTPEGRRFDSRRRYFTDTRRRAYTYDSRRRINSFDSRRRLSGRRRVYYSNSGGAAGGLV